MACLRSTRALAPVIALVALLTACSSGSDGTTSTTEATTPVDFEPHETDEIAPPPEEGDGIASPQPAASLPDGYVEEELLVSGTATSFDAGETPDDGTWTATPGDEAEYRTRVIVRRPTDPAAFSGTVLVEWFNVSAIEASPEWGYLSEEIGREGHAYVGVSVQAQGVEGGDALLDVEVDEDQAAGAGVETDTSGLKNIDPVRYGSLTHPGDAFAFDMYRQVGQAVRERPEALLGDLDPQQVIAAGESQSAMFMTTFVNAVHPLAPTYDGFLIHSRGSVAVPLDGEFIRARAGTGDAEVEEAFRRGVLVRTDLDVPVMIVAAETDLTLLGYAHARQPDTDMIRTWEVAGTAHADAQHIRAVIGGPRDPAVGELVGCEAINTGPHKEVLQAAVHHLVGWVAGGAAPPEGARIELVDGDDPVIDRDEHGNALGGVRNPLVDVPVAVLSGDPPGDASIEDLAGGGDLCVLFGSTTPFDQATLVERYGDGETYLAQFRSSAEEQVEAGFLLQPDADALVSEAEANRSLFP